MLPEPRRMAFQNIPAAGGDAMPSATLDVIGVAGRWYLWQAGAPDMPTVGYGGFTSATQYHAFPLLVPFNAIWDRCAMVISQTDLTDAWRVALYRGDPDLGNVPDASGSGLLAELLFLPTISGVEQRIERVVNISEPGGSVVWAFVVVDNTLGAGTNQHICASGSSANVPGFGSAMTWDNYGIALGCRRSPAGARVAGAAFGPVPPDPFGAGWTDRQANQLVTLLQFRAASILSPMMG